MGSQQLATAQACSLVAPVAGEVLFGPVRS